MRYYLSGGKAEATWQRQVVFEQVDGDLVVHVSSSDGVADKHLRIDYCSLERGRALHLIVDGVGHDVYLTQIRGGFEVQCKGRQIRVDVADERELLARQIHGASKSGAREIRASMPGIVVRIDAAEAMVVEVGETLLVLEAMKMQNPITSDGAGTVAKIHVSTGQAVAAGDLLVTLA